MAALTPALAKAQAHSPAPFSADWKTDGMAIMDANEHRIASLSFAGKPISMKVTAEEQAANQELFLMAPAMLDLINDLAVVTDPGSLFVLIQRARVMVVGQDDRGPQPHPFVNTGYCAICGHHGDDCTGERRIRLIGEQSGDWLGEVRWYPGGPYHTNYNPSISHEMSQDYDSREKAMDAVRQLIAHHPDKAFEWQKVD